MKVTSREKIDRVIKALEKRLENIVSYRVQDKKIKFFQGRVNGDAIKRDYDDTKWEKVNLPYKWDMRRDAWFRKKFTVPGRIEGVPVDGSEIAVGVPGFMGTVVIAHAELFIDEKKILEAKSWMDFRYLFQVSKKASPGEEHIFTIHVYPKTSMTDSFSALPVIGVCYSNVDNIAFEIESFIEELRFGKHLPGGEDVICKSIDAIKLEGIKTIGIYELIDLINDIRKKLLCLKPIAKKYKVYLVGHAHIDMNWLWPMEETIEVCRNTFSTVDKIMDEFPDFCFSQSQAYVYKCMEERYPELFNKIKKRVKEGRWDITASTWVESEMNIANGEAIVRQILYAKKYIKDKFGFEPRICWQPDTFGHPYTIPQIIKKCGIEYYFFMRANKKDCSLICWEGPDGSKITAFNSAYSGSINTRVLGELALLTEREQGIKTSMYVYGVGDHGGGPTREDIRLAIKLNEKGIFPELEFSTAHDYFDIISNSKVKAPVVRDELNPTFDGCYTTHWDTKLHNRECERLMLDAEVLGAVGKLLGGVYPDLSKQWEITLFNQFHDILPGCAVKSTYEFSNKQAEETEKIAKGEIKKSISYISTKVELKGGCLALFVFNSLSWKRTDVVEVELKGDVPKSPVIRDEDGNVHTSQILDGKLIFIARDIPPLGYKVFYISEGEGNYDESILKDSLTLENEFFILEIGEETGTISYLYDKVNNKIVMKKCREDYAILQNVFPNKLVKIKNPIPSTGLILNNVIQVLYEEPHLSSAWVIGPISKIVNLMKDTNIEIISEGPVVGRIRVKNKFNNSTIIQDISIYNGIDRIDFDTYIDWKEKADFDIAAPMLKASFTPILGNARATYEIPYGYIERVADGREFPALNWVDISDDEYGFSLLSNLKYGFDISGNTVRITLIRTSYEPDPEPDIGKHRFTYSVYPHKGNWKEADTVRKGYELNHPLIASYIKEPDVNKSISKNENLLPQSKSFINIDSDNVILTCLKKAEDSNDLILRVYESKGKEAKTTVKFGFNVESVKEVNLIEKSLINSNILLNNNEVSFKIAPHEIKTFRIKVG